MMKKKDRNKEREYKTKPKLTQYGQYAEQDRYQGVNTHSHPPSSGFALRRNPPGITPTRLQQHKQWVNQDVRHRMRLDPPSSTVWNTGLMKFMTIKKQILQFICVLKRSSQHTHTHTHTHTHRPWLPVWWCWSGRVVLRHRCGRPRCSPWGHPGWTAPFSQWRRLCCLKKKATYKYTQRARRTWQPPSQHEFTFPVGKIRV